MLLVCSISGSGSGKELQGKAKKVAKKMAKKYLVHYSLRSTSTIIFGALSPWTGEETFS